MIAEGIEKDFKAGLIHITKTTATSWTAQSQSSDKIYHINGDECECPDCKIRNNYCKHLRGRDLHEFGEIKKVLVVLPKICIDKNCECNEWGYSAACKENDHSYRSKAVWEKKN